MFMYIRAVIIGFALVIQPSITAAQTLWQNVTTGMSPEEVRAAQPSAKVEPFPEKLGNGAECSLSIDGYEIGPGKYKVCFYFKESRLDEVMISSTDTTYKGRYDAIVTAVRAKYGPELSSRRTPVGYESDWATKDGVNIIVLYIDQFSPLLNIVYQTRLRAESDKL